MNFFRLKKNKQKNRQFILRKLIELIWLKKHDDDDFLLKCTWNKQSMFYDIPTIGLEQKINKKKTNFFLFHEKLNLTNTTTITTAIEFFKFQTFFFYLLIRFPAKSSFVKVIFFSFFPKTSMSFYFHHGTNVSWNASYHSHWNLFIFKNFLKFLKFVGQDLNHHNLYTDAISAIIKHFTFGGISFGWRLCVCLMCGMMNDGAVFNMKIIIIIITWPSCFIHTLSLCYIQHAGHGIFNAGRQTDRQCWKKCHH